MTFLTASTSKAGGREMNQDFCDCVVGDRAACWVIADGLGGHRGGEIASHIAVEQILTSFRADPAFSPEALRRHLEAAQQAIIQRQQEDERLVSMRATAVVLLTDHQGVLWGHVGDTRLYHLREGRLVFQTKDHSVPQAMVAAGDLTSNQIRLNENRNRLLRTLGKEGDMRPTIEEASAPLQVGDAFLLCTDGFWEYVLETEMEVDFARAVHPEEWLAKMEERLWERVQGEHDNYSAVGIFVEPEGEAALTSVPSLS